MPFKNSSDNSPITENYICLHFPQVSCEKNWCKRGLNWAVFFLSQQLLTIVTLNTKWHEKNVRDEKGFSFEERERDGEKSLIGVSRSVCHTKYFIFYGVACQLDSFFEERWCFFVICDLLALLQQPLRQCSVTHRGSGNKFSFAINGVQFLLK